MESEQLDPAPETPLDVLGKAIQTYASTQGDGALLVTNSLVAWEEIRYDQDGTALRQMKYAVPSENFSLSSTLGLLEGAGVYIRRDILGLDGESED